VRDFKRALITGAAGAGARCMIEYLQKNQPQIELHGAVRNRNARKVPEGVVVYEVDLLDTGSIIWCLNKSLPDVIFHLAANPDKGFEIPSAILTNNAIGSCNLFQSVLLTTGGDSVIVSPSSSEIYGNVEPEEVPIKEDCPKRPVSPYAVAKLAQDNLASVYCKVYGMQIITTRPVSYNNFYRTNLFTSNFARQIACIEQGKQTVLKHGNLANTRILCDARDIAEAHWLAATKCTPGHAYNIGDGQQVTVGEVLDKLCHFSTCHIPTQQDPILMRLVDVTLQVPDCSKFKMATGWQPRIDLDRSLQDLLNYWREEVGKE
jgi:GDP-4-dehydro-6-deoxy-D-mannose reductase